MLTDELKFFKALTGEIAKSQVYSLEETFSSESILTRLEIR
jgi:hypothetical protein